MDQMDDTPGQAPRSRLENEVLEILQRSDREPTNVVRFSDAVRQQRWSFSRQIRQTRLNISLTSTNLLVACIALAVVAVFVEDASTLAARLFGLASVAALVALFVRGFVRPEASGTKQWRGRDIDFSSRPRPDWLDRRFRGPKGPRR